MVEDVGDERFPCVRFAGGEHHLEDFVSVDLFHGGSVMAVPFAPSARNAIWFLRPVSERL
jgi:hypothetical protein